MQHISRFTLLLILAILMTIGAAVLTSIDVAEQPRARQGRTLTVNYWWNGASAKVMEQNVTSKIEGLVGAVKGVKSVESESNFGSARIVIELKPQADVSAVKFEIMSLLRQTHRRLPEGVSFPNLTGGDVAGDGQGANKDMLLLTYRVNADMNDERLSEYVKQNIEVELRKRNDITRIEITGGRRKYIEIAYNSQTINCYGITARDIEDGIRSFMGKDDYYLCTESFARPLEQMPIKMVDGKMVYLNDLATFEYKDKLPDSYFRVNGLNTIYLNIYVDKNADKIMMSHKLRTNISNLQQKLKKGVYLHVEHDSAEKAESELTKLIWRTMLVLAILMVFVWIVSGSVRYLAVTIISLTADILLAALCYKLLDIRLHIYSLAGITVSIGLVIDATVVMVDHYSYYRNRKAFLAILAALLTTIGSLVVVFGLPEFLKDNLYDFAQIIIVNLSVALIVALLFVPALIDQLNYRSRNSRHTGNRRRMAAWSKFYSSYLRFTATGKRRWVAMAVFVLLPAYPLYHFGQKVVEGQYSGRQREKEVILHIRAKMPVGGSVHELNDKVAILEHFLSDFKEIKRFETKVASWGATVDVEFKDEYKNTSFPFMLENKVISRIITIGGADWSTYGISDRGFSNSLNLQYRSHRIEIVGYNYERLYRIAEDMCRKMRTNNRVVDLAIVTPGHENQEDEFFADYNKERISLYNFNVRDAHSALKEKTDERIIPKYRDRYIAADIYLKPVEKNAFDLWNVNNATLQIGDRNLCLADFMDIERREANNCIPKRNQEYMLHVAFNVLASYTYTDKYVKSIIDEFNGRMPVGFRCKNASMGYYDDDGSQYWMLLAIVVIIYFICAILFESLWLPLAIVMLIPLSFVGAFIAWDAVEVRFSPGSFAALVMLCGLTVNAGIYIIAEYQNQKSAAMSVLSRNNSRLYVRAYNHKIKAVFLTLLSTVLGLVPFFIDGSDEEFWFSFATGVAGGLALSVVALVFVMPAFVNPTARKAINI